MLSVFVIFSFFCSCCLPQIIYCEWLTICSLVKTRNVNSEILCVFIRLNDVRDTVAERDKDDLPQVTLYVAERKQSCLSVTHYNTSILYHHTVVLAWFTRVKRLMRGDASKVDIHRGIALLCVACICKLLESVLWLYSVTVNRDTNCSCGMEMVRENHSVFCLIRALVDLSKGMWAVKLKLCSNRICQFLTGSANWCGLTCAVAVKRLLLLPWSVSV